KFALAALEDEFHGPAAVELMQLGGLVFQDSSGSAGRGAALVEQGKVGFDFPFGREPEVVVGARGGMSGTPFGGDSGPEGDGIATGLPGVDDARALAEGIAASLKRLQSGECRMQSVGIRGRRSEVGSRRQAGLVVACEVNDAGLEWLLSPALSSARGE